MSFELLVKSRLIAIVRLEDLGSVDALVGVLLDAGIRCIELTMTNPLAADCVSRLRRSEGRFENGQALIGLGSIRNLEEAHMAIEAGAQFLVSPIASRSVIELAVHFSIPIAAGAMTPTEIAMAWDAGATLVKVFPARSLGPSYIRDVLAPMPYLKLMPTGGIDLQNARSYLDAGAVAVGVGGPLCRADWAADSNWSAIHAAASAFVDAVADGC